MSTSSITVISDSAPRGDVAASTFAPRAVIVPDVGAGLVTGLPREDTEHPAHTVPVVAPHGDLVLQDARQASVRPMPQDHDLGYIDRRANRDTVLMAVRVGLQHFLKIRNTTGFVPVPELIACLKSSTDFGISEEIIRKIIVDCGTPTFSFKYHGATLPLRQES